LNPEPSGSALTIVISKMAYSAFCNTIELLHFGHIAKICSVTTNNWTHYQSMPIFKKPLNKKKYKFYLSEIQAYIKTDKIILYLLLYIYNVYIIFAA